LSTTLQEQGIHGLYRGILPPLLSVGLVQAATFTIYQHMKNALDGKVQCQTFLAGLVSGAIPSFFTLPSYYVKVQLQNEKGKFGTGTLQYCCNLMQQHGVRPVLRAMYGKALVASVLCDSFGRGFYFGTYDYIKSSLASTDAELTLPHRLLAACLSGTAGWTSIYFLDTLRSRIMAGPVGSGLSGMDVARQIYQEGGIRAFYRGYYVTIIRAVPVAACVLPTYDLVYYKLRSWGM
jgi:solute carrier family 25 carnitine/acylcarnitine transporter 20/29